MAFGSLQSHCHTVAEICRGKLSTMMEPHRTPGSRTGTLLSESAQELLNRGQETCGSAGVAVQQVAKGLAEVGATGTKDNSAPPRGSLAGESLQMFLEWTLPRDAYTFLRSFRFKSDDIKVVFAAQTAVGGAFD